MAPRKIKPGVYSVGAIDWDRRLFDSLIPLPLGTSYNAYLVQGKDKVALIDTVEPGLAKDLFANLDELGVKKIDYVICHHAEQDHSGSIPAVLERYPGAKVVTNQKCADLLSSHLRVPTTACEIIADGAVLDLGGRSLQFIFAPWVHWPETMFSYLREDKILFTCDFFGSHFATGTLYADDEHHVYLSAKRYYAEIMMPFRQKYPAYLQKIDALAPEIIAPSHGPIYRRPEFILDAYKDWTSDKVKNEALVAYVSMHGSTKIMVDRLVDRLVTQGINVKQFDLATVDIGELAMALVDAATLVLATPTVLRRPPPRRGLRRLPGGRHQTQTAPRRHHRLASLGRKNRRHTQGPARWPETGDVRPADEQGPAHEETPRICSPSTSWPKPSRPVGTRRCRIVSPMA
jgi:flavorubredoxin